MTVNGRRYLTRRLKGEIRVPNLSGLRLKCDDTRAETRLRLLRNGGVHLNRRKRQFSRQLEAELCASAVVMLDTCSEVV
jgi:hypothetical protein